MKVAMLKRSQAAGIMIFVAASIIGAGLPALEVEYVELITDGLHSPTSVVATADFVAVLDPYSEEITVFSPDGLISHKIHVHGDAHALTQIDQGKYAYCDRSQKKVVAYDLEASRQYDYLGDQPGLLDPVDLICLEGSLHVLDAGSSSILVYNENGVLDHVVLLKNETGSALKFASSFVFNTREKCYYVMDQTKSRICKFDNEGRFLSSLASFGPNDGHITRGGEIEITDDGLVLVTDRYQGRVGIFGGDGSFLGFFGGANGERRLAIPTGISIDENGLVYVVSTMSAAIEVYFLPPLIDQSDLLNAIQQSPENESVVIGGEVTLESYVEAYHAADRVTGFEFQVFDDGSSIEPVSVSPLIPPVSFITLQNGRQMVSAYWQPEIFAEENASYWWRSRVYTKDTVGVWTALSSFIIAAMPRQYRLDQNVPNPFNPETQISFTLADGGDVVLEVISVLGQKVRTLVQSHLAAGDYQIIWDGRDNDGHRVASGIYFYRLHARDFSQTRKMVLLK